MKCPHCKTKLVLWIKVLNLWQCPSDWTYTFAAATPQVYTLKATSGTGSNQKSYFVNEEGVIRFHLPAANGDGVAAAVTDQPIP